MEMVSELKINFYQLSPEDMVLPVLRRQLRNDEACTEKETLLKLPTAEGFQRFAILSQFPISPVPKQFQSHLIRFDRLPRLARTKLLESGLCHHFRQQGFKVVRKKFSFDVFDKESTVPCRLHGLKLNRGLSFQLDYFFRNDRPVWGYFITLKLRRSFVNGLSDSVLKSISIGRRVFADTHDDLIGSCTLQEIRGSDAILVCQTHSVRVPLDHVTVPPSADIISAYVKASHAGTNSFAELLEDEQFASFRRTTRGAKRQDAIKAQNDFVMSWLVRNSEYGRLRYPWPFSEKKITILTTPHTIIPAQAEVP